MSIKITFKNGEKLLAQIKDITEINEIIGRKGYKMAFVREIRFVG